MACPYHPTEGIVVYSSELCYMSKIEHAKIMGQLHGITVHSETYLYVSDYDNNCIHLLGSYGDYLDTFGNKGAEPLTQPLGLCAFGQYVYVCNKGYHTRNHSIYVFTIEGKFATKFGEKGELNGQFNLPYSTCVDRYGFFYVSDYCNNRVQNFYFY